MAVCSELSGMIAGGCGREGEPQEGRRTIWRKKGGLDGGS